MAAAAKNYPWYERIVATLFNAAVLDLLPEAKS